jgi:hypothetical protein
MQTEDFNFFGIPAENIRAATQRHSSGKHPDHTIVPSRKDIATLPEAELRGLLVGWMENGATEIIPSRAQIALVREILQEREDARQLTQIIAMCNNFIDGA